MERERERGNQTTGTRLKAGFVLEVSVEQIVAIEAALSASGAKILYRRVAAPGTRLWIVERPNDSRRSEGSW